MKSFGLSLEDAQPRNKWRRKIEGGGQLANPSLSEKLLLEWCVCVCVCVCVCDVRPCRQEIINKRTDIRLFLKNFKNNNHEQYSC